MTQDCTGSAARLSVHVEEREWEAAIGVLDACWTHLLSTDPHVVRQTVRALPADVIRAHPRWTSAMQYLERMSSDASTTTRFREGRSGAPAGLLDVLASLTAQAAASRARGAFADACRAATEARDLVSEATPDALRALSVALPELTYQWAMVWEFAGDPDRAVREYSEAFDLARTAGNDATATIAAGSVAWVHALAGRTKDAREWLARIVDTTGHAWHGRVDAITRLTRGTLAMDALDFASARSELDGITQRTAAERWPFRTLLASRLASSPSAALDLLVELDTYAATNPPELSEEGVMRAVFALASVSLNTAIGNHSRATALLQDPSTGVGATADLLALASASAAASAGDVRRARQSTERIRATATSSPRLLVGALALLAASHHEQGASDDAAATFHLACDLARSRSLFMPLTFAPRRDLEALIAAAPNALPVEIARTLLTFTPAGALDPFRTLTTSELRVLDELLGGATTSQAAAALVLSPNTVKTQVRSIFRKIGVHSRSDLVATATRFGYHPDEGRRPQRRNTPDR